MIGDSLDKVYMKNESKCPFLSPLALVLRVDILILNFFSGNRVISLISTDKNRVNLAISRNFWSFFEGFCDGST
jgi:hypothetical protein